MLLQYINSNVFAYPMGKKPNINTYLTTGYLPDLLPREMSADQQKDTCLRLVWSMIRQKHPADSIQSNHPDMLFLKKECENLLISQDLLYRDILKQDKNDRQQLLLHGFA